jgi:hypothetical protein
MFFHITAVISIRGYEPSSSSSSSSCYTVMSFFVSFCCLYMKKDTSYCPKLMLVVSSSGKNQKVKKVKKDIQRDSQRNEQGCSFASKDIESLSILIGDK